MGVPENRKRRYLEKISFAKENFYLLEKWIEEELDILHIKAIYKVFQEIVETAMDLCAMLVKDMGLEVSDDYSNIEKLEIQWSPRRHCNKIYKETKKLT